MSEPLMLLPSKDPTRIRLLRIPEDTDPNEAFRSATGIIAGVEQQAGGFSQADIDDALEDHGFQMRPFTLGPELG